jgi:hypothetical protein
LSFLLVPASSSYASPSSRKNNYSQQLLLSLLLMGVFATAYSTLGGLYFRNAYVSNLEEDDVVKHTARLPHSTRNALLVLEGLLWISFALGSVRYFVLWINLIEFLTVRKRNRVRDKTESIKAELEQVKAVGFGLSQASRTRSARDRIVSAQDCAIRTDDDSNGTDTVPQGAGADNAVNSALTKVNSERWMYDSDSAYENAMKVARTKSFLTKQLTRC